MKKFLHLQCTVCKRSIDQLVDNTHVASDRCTITLRCTGRLIPVVYRNNALIATPPMSGVEDWTSRHATPAKALDTAASMIMATTGPVAPTTEILPRLVVALRFSDAIAATLTSVSRVTLTLNKKVETVTAFTQFVFRRDVSFSSIEGVESGIEKKTLSYNLASQTVEVYLNGVKKVRAKNGLAGDYWLDGDDASALKNAITFTTLISQSGITQVDVIVTPIVSTVTTTIQLHRNQYDESRIKTGAWENVDSIERFIAGAWVRYYLFTADVGLTDALLDLNAIYTLNSTLEILNTGYKSSDSLLLLAHAPYTTIDRYVTLAAPLANISGANFLKYHVSASAKILQLTAPAVAEIYPPLRLTKFKVEPPLTTDPGGTSNTISLDGSVILGPDA